jgi:hypothetical protein
VSEEFTIREKLSDKEEALFSFDNFIKGDDMTVPNPLQYLDLSYHSLHILWSHLALVDDLDSHFLAGRQVQGQMHLAERPFPDILA